MNLFATIRALFSGQTPQRPTLAGDVQPIRARFDAAMLGGVNENHWLAADGMDADSAHSLAVRRRLTYRSRYETGNNGYGKGSVLTQGNYVVGRGPSLRMQTRSAGFNAMVEAAWRSWCKRVQFARKLRTAVKAKTTDGEAFLIAKTNPALRHAVKLDLVGIECEQFSTPNLPINAKNRIDGIEFDEFGNPLFYDLLKSHPGAAWQQVSLKADRIPAKFVFHLFRQDRPGQHRAVPETTASLNGYAQGRRFREATLSAAEAIANFSILLKTQQTPDAGADLVEPMSTLPVQKAMFTALPAGYDAYQPRPEQPPANYESFTRTQISEQARPLGQSYNIAAADSSGYSFSGGKLDHTTYFVGVDTDQMDIEDQVLDPCFELWCEEACHVYGWAGDPQSVPDHSWDWPAKPVIDDVKTANARKVDLGTGVSSLRRIYAEKGLDFEEELQAMAEDYGVTPDEMRTVLLNVNLLAKVAQPQETAEPEDDEDTPPPRPAAGRNGTNGYARQRT